MQRVESKAMRWWTERALVGSWLRWREFHVEYQEAVYLMKARIWVAWADLAENHRARRLLRVKAIGHFANSAAARALGRWNEYMDSARILRRVMLKMTNRRAHMAFGR